MSDSNSQIRKKIADSLNKHGFAFQYAVLRKTEELTDVNKVPWLFQVGEFPVSINGASTRIDFVLQHATRELFLVCECKRVDPAFAWSFTQAPFVRRGYDQGEVLVDQVHRLDGYTVRAGHVRLRVSSDKIFHVGLPFRTGEKGNGADRLRNDQIEDSATQVFRGVNGFINRLAEEKDLLKERSPAKVIPVVFTTAKLYSSGVDLECTDLESGKLTQEMVDPEEQPWLWLRYHISPDLRHTVDPDVSVSPEHWETELPDILDSEFARTIAVVNTGGIEEFLRYMSAHG